MTIAITLLIILYVMPIIGCVIINQYMPEHEICKGLQYFAFCIPALNLFSVFYGLYILGYNQAVADVGSMMTFDRVVKEMNNVSK
jgi:cytochrome c biogenesis protein ResB